MNLPDYIQQVGDEAFAKRFKIAPRTAMAYRLRERIPRTQLAQRLVKETPVTWEGIYGPQVLAKLNS